MTSLPLISHHLFVAAIQNQVRRPAPHSQVGRAQTEVWSPAFRRPTAPCVDSIPLEVLTNAKTLPAHSVRPLRAALVGGAS